MQPPDKTIARANIDVLKDPPKPDQAAFDDAQSSPDPICVIPRTSRVFGALVKLPIYNNNFLYIAREVDPLAVEFPAVARERLSSICRSMRGGRASRSLSLRCTA